MIAAQVRHLARALQRHDRPPRHWPLRGSIEQAPALVGEVKFDVITLNWALHHLVGKDYQQPLLNIQNERKVVSTLMSPSSVLIIVENE